MKILLLDIETSPNTAHIWGLRDQYINPSHLLESSYVLCWAAKWYGKSEIMFNSVHKSNQEDMLKEIHDLLNQADTVVHYNGSRFDIPVLNKEFLLHDFKPCSSYKQIDLLRTMRKEFRFPSNKLDYIAQRLKLGKKTDHEGYTLWVKCMNGDPKSWKKMEQYNKQDVVLLEKVYKKVLPWIKNHPNHNLFEGKGCSSCGSHRLTKQGFKHTTTGTYQRYQCQDCGSWSKDTKALKKHSSIAPEGG
jgi:DNA polymerase elongation subunit (family B)